MAAEKDLRWDLGALLLLGLIFGIGYVVTFDPWGREEELWDSMRHMSTLRKALEQYESEKGGYPPTDGWTTLGAVQGALKPTPGTPPPLEDAWGSLFQYRSDGATYSLRSLGRDGLAQSPEPVGEMESLDDDIVMTDGSFVSFPPGGSHC